MATFKEIPKLTRSPGYCIDVDWYGLETQLEHWLKEDRSCPLDLEPDFQRGHVWTPKQQSDYVEYILRGGFSGKDIFFNCVGWQGSFKGPFVLVDGKQRLTAVRGFLANTVAIFNGIYFRDFTDVLRASGASFKFHVNDLPTRAEVLRWYLEMNSGGTPHTTSELLRVRELLEGEKKK
jgi:hypothetical protein